MFKDIIANDIDRVFLNTEEYADEARINGKKLKIVLDNEHLSNQNNLQELDGVIGDIFYYVSKQAWLDNFGRLPLAHDAQEFNRIPCTVEKVGDTNGMLDITLSYRG